MKELTIEQKAQRYDEAIEIAKRINNEQQAQPFNIMTRVFPELKESEDGMIRKWLIGLVEEARKANPTNAEHNGMCSEAIAWLEKQGEHAKFRDSIQVGDKVTRNEDGVLVNLSQLKRVAKKDEKQGKNNMGISEATKQELEDNLNKALEKETPESCNEFLEKQSEQKPADTEKEAKGSKREIPNSAWSEEDEDMLKIVIKSCEQCGNEYAYYWLNSLKERYTWKPSDEQMKALDEVIRNPYLSTAEYNGLIALKEQLKAL